MSVFLLAELGSTHDGDWSKVVDMVAACADAGFNGVKLQYWSSADRLADRRKATPVYRDIYRRHAIPAEWLPKFADLCRAHHVDPVCTVYLPEDVAVVAPHVDRLKIASFENSDDALIASALDIGKPVIVSRGMQNSEFPGYCVPEWVFNPGGDAVTQLACVSAYPAPLRGALSVMLPTYAAYDGYSDHTANVLTGAVAVGAGATFIEVHVRHKSTRIDNPDFAPALSPDEARQYARNVRTAELLMDASVTPDESAMRRFKVEAGTA